VFPFTFSKAADERSTQSYEFALTSAAVALDVAGLP
jgi:hypothetical protein